MRRPLHFVRHGGQVPGDVVEIFAWTDECVRYFALGGGSVRSMTPEEFSRLHRRVSQEEVGTVTWRAGVFDIDGLFGDLPGYTTGRRWNGWACPCFPLASCEVILSRCSGAHLDPETQAAIIPREDAGPGDPPEEIYPATTILVAGQPVEVWAIGCGCWTWCELDTAEER